MATRTENISRLNAFSQSFRIDDPADRLEVREGRESRYIVVAMGYALAVPADTAKQAARVIRDHYHGIRRDGR